LKQFVIELTYFNSTALKFRTIVFISTSERHVLQYACAHLCKCKEVTNTSIHITVKDYKPAYTT